MMKNTKAYLFGTVVIALLVGDIAAHSGLAQAEKQAPEVPSTVTAHEFRLVNGEGQTTALLSSSKNGSPLFVMLDKKRQSRIVISIDGDDALLGVLDANGAPGVEMDAGKDPDDALNKSSVTVFGEKGATVQLSRDQKSCGLALTDTNGKKCAGLAYSPALRSAVLLVGDSDHHCGFTAMNISGKCQIAAQDSIGKVVWRKP